MATRSFALRRDREGQGVHDTVVGLLASRWRNPAKYNITTNPGSEKERWVGSDSNYPDLVGWVRGVDHEKAVWIAEVETSASVTENEAREQWAKYDLTGVPFYLVVPGGFGRTAKVLTARVKLSVERFYEFSFSAGILVLTQV